MRVALHKRLIASVVLALVPNLIWAQNAPTFTYSSPGWLEGQVVINSIATDFAGNTYLTGTTQPGAILTTPGAFQSQDNSTGICGNIFPVSVGIPCIGSFVEKLSP